MIKIVKPGQKEFTCTCQHCNCEFTYELEDIQLANVVSCPTCGNLCVHKNNTSIMPNIGWPYSPNATPIPCNTNLETNKTDPCAGCTWRETMLKDGGVYVGDTPCTWCSKNKFYCGLDTALNYGTTAVLKPVYKNTKENSTVKTATIGEFPANIETILAVEVSDCANTPVQDPVMVVDETSVDMIGTSVSLQENENVSGIMTDIVPLDILPELDLSAKDIITADEPTSSDSYINNAIASAKKKRSYKKKSVK